MSRRLLFIILGVATIEILARVLLSIDLVYDRVIRPYYFFDETAERLRWIRNHKNKKSTTYYTFDKFDPTKGWITRSDIKNMTVFKNKILNTNSKGLRGKAEYTYEKQKDKVRILIFGDSFTFGDEVSDTDTYPAQLQNMLPQAEVINFAVHGYGHDQMLILLREEGVRYNPDIIILGYIKADNFRNTLNFKDYSKPKFKLINNQLVLTNSPVPSPETLLKQEIYKSKLLDMLTILYKRVLANNDSYNNDSDRITEAILDEFVNTTLEIGAILVFVNLAVDFPNARPEAGNDKFFGYFCNTKGLHCTSLLRYFSTKVNKHEKLFEYEGHWNEKGNLLAAEGIYDYLIDNNLVPKSSENVLDRLSPWKEDLLRAAPKSMLAKRHVSSIIYWRDE